MNIDRTTELMQYLYNADPMPTGEQLAAVGVTVEDMGAVLSLLKTDAEMSWAQVPGDLRDLAGMIERMAPLLPPDA